MSPAAPPHRAARALLTSKLPMKLRTRLNLVVAGLTAAFVIVLISAEIQATRALHPRGDRGGQPRRRPAARAAGASFIRAKADRSWCCRFCSRSATCAPMIWCCADADGNVLYRSPPPTYKAGARGAARGSRSLCRLLLPSTRSRFPGPWSSASRRTLRDLCSMPGTTCRSSLSLAAVMLVIVNAVAFWSGGARACALSRHHRRPGAHPTGRPGAFACRP